VLTGCKSCHDHDGGAVLVGCRGCKTLDQERPPFVLLVSVISIWRCPSIHTALIFLHPALGTSSASIVHRPGARLVTPLYLPLVASVPRGTPAPGVDVASLGVISVEVDGASPRPGDDTRGLLRDWVISGAGIGALGSVAPGDATLGPGSSGVAGPRVSSLLLPGPPPTPTFCPRLSTRGRWRSTRCSRAHRSPLWRGILHLIWVSFKKRQESLPVPLQLPSSSLTSSYLCFCSTCPGVARTCLCCGQR
jgi:hypothetical protein